MRKTASILNWEGLREREASYQRAFSEGDPFRYVVMEDVLREDAAQEIEAGFEAALAHKDHASPKSHRNVLKKTGTPNLKVMTDRQVQFFEEVNSPEFIKYLSDLTGITPILGDMELKGGGLHSSVRGGYLNVHTDFNFHPTENTHRRLNLIFYANTLWKEEWEGALEFWNSDISERRAQLYPRFNRAVLFETSEISFHGHPIPLACPEGVTRKSLAVYYYSDWPTHLDQRAKTNYVLTPTQLGELKAEISKAILNGAQTFQEAAAMIPDFQPYHVKHAFSSVIRSIRSQSPVT